MWQGLRSPLGDRISSVRCTPSQPRRGAFTLDYSSVYILNRNTSSHIHIGLYVHFQLSELTGLQLQSQKRIRLPRDLRMIKCPLCPNDSSGPEKRPIFLAQDRKSCLDHIASFHELPDYDWKLVTYNCRSCGLGFESSKALESHECCTASGKK